MIDAHCHLNDEKFAGQVSEVIRRAVEAGVVKMICVGTGKESSTEAIRLAHKYPGVWATVGVHPEEKEETESLIELAGDEKVVAIGETGLDFYENTREAEKERQISLMKRHIDIANKLNLPVVVHNRNGDEEILKILSDLEVDAQMHCFSGGQEFMEECVKRGWYIGIGGLITFKGRDNLREVVKMIPGDKLLLETDAPYLAPEPIRGTVNEPKNVRIIAEWTARIRNVTINQIDEETTENAKMLFKKL